MTSESFATAEIISEMNDDVARPMLDLILAFARLDTSLSAWLVQAYGMPLERGALFVENMDIGNKINRLKKLYDHDDDHDAVSALAKLRKEFDGKKSARNTIAHATFVGVLKSSPKTAVFSPMRAGDAHGQLQIVCIPADHMEECLGWANNAADAVILIFSRLQGRLEQLP